MFWIFFNLSCLWNKDATLRFELEASQAITAFQEATSGLVTGLEAIVVFKLFRRLSLKAGWV